LKGDPVIQVDDLAAEEGMVPTTMTLLAKIIMSATMVVDINVAMVAIGSLIRANYACC
jgi:hypothetical protein|tara:strand:- start:50566 stop:50739 length:174 start_codon:yes stop_codon:yes gene_type:complete